MNETYDEAVDDFEETPLNLIEWAPDDDTTNAVVVPRGTVRNEDDDDDEIFYLPLLEVLADGVRHASEGKEWSARSKLQEEVNRIASELPPAEYRAALRGESSDPLLADALTLVSVDRPRGMAPARLKAPAALSRNEPGILFRDDSVGLFYPGLVHDLHGASESGKSWVSLAAAVAAIKAGKRAAMVDYESDESTIAERLLLLGLTEPELDEFDYYSPSIDGDNVPDYSSLRHAWREYGVIIFDGMTTALAAHNIASTSQGEIAGWYRNVAHGLAVTTAAAVILVDHITKDQKSSRYALGAVAKLNAITGTSVMVRSKRFGRGIVGEIRLYLAKDRPGYLSSHCGASSGELAELATVMLDSTVEGRVSVTVKAPETKAPAGERLEDAIVAFVEANPRCATRAVRDNVTGDNGAIGKALGKLVIDGLLSVETVGASKKYSIADPEDVLDDDDE